MAVSMAFQVCHRHCVLCTLFILELHQFERHLTTIILQMLEKFFHRNICLSLISTELPADVGQSFLVLGKVGQENL